MPNFSSSQSFEHSDRNISELDNGANFEAPEKALILQNRYAIIKPLGHGGMGTVFLAQDKHLSNRFCVVKKLRLEGFNNDDKQKATTFFEREATILSSLKHPNIVLIQDYFQEHGNYFLVMEYVKGDNLQQLLRKREEPFNEAQVINWASVILDVLRYLHSHNPPVIYRDIKPSNIMLSPSDDIKLVDFGIARPYAAQENTHVISGGYSPPEQYWGAADLRSDIYALGTTMYYLLTGKEPLALQTCNVRRSQPIISESLDKVIQRATSQDVWLRYQTADEMYQALSEIRNKAAKALIPNYVLAVCLAFLMAASVAFVFCTFIDKNGYFHEKAMAIFSSSKDIENSDKKVAALWQIPFEIATLASSEEIITDPDGIKINKQSVKQTIKQSQNKKKR